MAKRNLSVVPGDEEVTEGIDIQEAGEYTEPEQSVRLESKFPAKLKFTGPVSGKQYVWEQAGSVVEVDAEDYPLLKSKRMGKGLCCGTDNYLFSQV